MLIDNLKILNKMLLNKRKLLNSIQQHTINDFSYLKRKCILFIESFKKYGSFLQKV